jgi:hypothetical protein
MAWQEDPSNPEQLQNFSGGFNSILHVEEQREEISAWGLPNKFVRGEPGSIGSPRASTRWCRAC